MGGSGDENDGFTTLKCTLARLLKPSVADGMLRLVDDYVRRISQSMRRASLLLLVHLLRCVEEDAELPDLYAVTDTYWRRWIIMDPKLGVEEMVTYDRVRQYVEEVEYIKTAEYCQVTAYAARTFKTVVKNSMWVPLIPRLTRLCKVTARHFNAQRGPGVPIVPSHALMNALRNDRVPTQWPAWADGFVKDVRTRLGCRADQFLWDEYAKPRREGPGFTRVFRFYVWMSERFRALQARGIRLSPVIKVQRCFVRLDVVTLSRFAEKLGLPSDCGTDEAMAWSLFDKEAFPRLNDQKRRYVPRISIQTDGVAVGLQVERIPASSATPRSSRTPPDFVPGRDLMIGIDGGRVNIATAAADADDITAVSTLTRTEYYHRSYIGKLAKRQRSRMQELRDAWSDLGADGSALRTHRLADVISYLQGYAAVRNRWWNIATARSTSRDRFEGYKGKRRVVDKYFANLRRVFVAEFQRARQYAPARVEVAYGQAVMSMRPTGRGELAVPTTGAYKASCRVFGKQNVHVTCEFGTTKYRAGGDGSGNPVVMRPAYRGLLKGAATVLPRNRGGRPLRGLRYCPVSRSFRSRDGYAAKSIARNGVLDRTGEPREPWFRRGFRMT